MVGQGEKYNAGRIPQREASRLKWLDKERNIIKMVGQGRNITRIDDNTAKEASRVPRTEI